MDKTTKENVKSRASMIIDGEIEPEKREAGLLNLRKRKSFDTWDREKHIEACKKGRKAQIEYYGQKKSAKEALENILTLKATDEIMQLAGADESLIARLKASTPNATIYDVINAVAVGRALEGNINALQYVRDTNGDKPIDQAKIDVNGVMTDQDRALLSSINDRLAGVETVKIVAEITPTDVKSPANDDQIGGEITQTDVKTDGQNT